MVAAQDLRKVEGVGEDAALVEGGRGEPLVAALVAQRLPLHEAEVARDGEAVAAHGGAGLRVGHAAHAHRREALSGGNRKRVTGFYPEITFPVGNIIDIRPDHYTLQAKELQLINFLDRDHPYII